MTTDKYQNRYRIPSARATWHDYNGGEYFITICTAHRKHYFGEIENGEMIKNELGEKLDTIIMDIPNHQSYAKSTIFQVMPNHVHLIVSIDDGAANRDAAGTDATGRDVACRVSKKSGTPPPTESMTDRNEIMRVLAQKRGLLSVAMGSIKSALTHFARTHQIEFRWQERFHDHIIRDQEEMNRIANYIINNPSNWKEDKFYSE